MFFAYCFQKIDHLLLLIRPHLTNKEKEYVYQNNETSKILIYFKYADFLDHLSLVIFTIVTEESELR